MIVDRIEEELHYKDQIRMLDPTYSKVNAIIVIKICITYEGYFEK